MRKTLLAGIVAALVATAVPASAHPTYHYLGGCYFTTVSDGAGDDQTTWTGAMHAIVIATDAGTGAPSPTPITVECHVYKNGVYQWGPNLATSGTGAVAASTQFVYQAAPGDVITVCTVVTVGGDSHTTCDDAITTPLVPEPVWEAVEALLDAVGPGYDPIDPLLCPILGQLAPGAPGALDITPEGDVYVAGEFFWDCPPYAV